MRSYVAAREFLGFLGFVAWCVIILGVVFAIGAGSAVSQTRGFGVGGGAMAGMMAALPGFILAFLGFLGLVLVQMGRAGVDTAEYTQQMLQIARDQLEVSKQSLKHGSVSSQGFSALQHDSPAADGPSKEVGYGKETASTSIGFAGGEPQKSYDPDDTITHRGIEIRAVDGGYVVYSQTYATLEDAKAKIDQKCRPPRTEPLFSRAKPDPVEVAPADLSASFKRS